MTPWKSIMPGFGFTGSSLSVSFYWHSSSSKPLNSQRGHGKPDDWLALNVKSSMIIDDHRSDPFWVVWSDRWRWRWPLTIRPIWLLNGSFYDRLILDSRLQKRSVRRCIESGPGFSRIRWRFRWWGGQSTCLLFHSILCLFLAGQRPSHPITKKNAISHPTLLCTH